MPKWNSFVVEEFCQNGKNCKKTRILPKWQETRIIPEKQETRIMPELQEDKNQVRIQEHKNLAWRDISCLASQDCIYTNLARKSRSVFSDKNLVQKEWQKNLVWYPRKTRIWTDRSQDRRLVIDIVDQK